MKGDAAPSSDAAPPPAPAAKALDKRPGTTSAGIALNNLNADINARLAHLDKPRRGEKLGLVELLLDRSHYLGTIADLEQAEKLTRASDADAGPRDAGEADAEEHFARAVVANALHRFDEALRELDAATQAGMPVARIHGTRASVFMARGQYDDALALQLPSIESQGSMPITTAAVLANRMQKPMAESERLFDLARDRFNDVSAFALAWMDFQRGSVLELDGDDKRARLWFAEAVDVLPQYAHAAVHLAPSEPPADAIKLLETVKATSDDPEVLAALAAAHKRAGHTAEEGPLLEQARKRYDEIVAKYPEAFADHAARFWLNAGNDPKKALVLARLNAKNRNTEEALDLWMATAAGAKDNAEVCLAVRAMAALKYLSARRRALVTASLAKCPD
ncbi:MAG: hypothetical protein U0270_44865 [Labilithrix sp.]